MAKEKSKKRGKFSAWIVLTILLAVLLVCSYIFGNDILEVINLGKNNDDTTETSNKEENHLSDSELTHIYNIIGIKDSSDSCGVQSVLTEVSGNIDNLSNKDKYNIIYFYAYNNKLLTNIKSDEYDECEAYGGECVAITSDNYNKIIKYYNITTKATDLFDSTNIYKDKYIFEVPDCTTDKYTHNLKRELKDDEVIVSDELIIGEEKQEIIYTFKKNEDKEYYLFSVK